MELKHLSKEKKRNDLYNPNSPLGFWDKLKTDYCMYSEVYGVQLPTSTSTYMHNAVAVILPPLHLLQNLASKLTYLLLHVTQFKHTGDLRLCFVCQYTLYTWTHELWTFNLHESYNGDKTVQIITVYIEIKKVVVFDFGNSVLFTILYLIII
jgi:hypothetical protein